MKSKLIQTRDQEDDADTQYEIINLLGKKNLKNTFYQLFNQVQTIRYFEYFTD